MAAMTLAEIGEVSTSWQAIQITLRTVQRKVAVHLFERLGPAVVDLVRVPGQPCILATATAAACSSQDEHEQACDARDRTRLCIVSLRHRAAGGSGTA